MLIHLKDYYRILGNEDYIEMIFDIVKIIAANSQNKNEILSAFGLNSQ